MIDLVWPWLLTLLPLPFLVYRFAPKNTRSPKMAMRVPFLADISPYQSETVAVNSHVSLWLAAFAWLLLVFALTRPQWLGEPLEQSISGRDLMLAVDLSASMQEQDFILNK
ncbi:MAG: hypothetical protein RL755_1867, partial [Pseudomonadota bacterium]